MSSVFSKISRGEIPSHKISEDDRLIAILDIMPLERGHTLVIPKHQVDLIFDLESEEYAALWLFARKVAKAIEKAIPCTRIGIAVIGLEVPHAHIHLIPLHKEPINFLKPKLNPSSEELTEVARLIKKVGSGF